MLLNSKTIKIGKLELSNPIMPASGTFGYGIEFKDFFDLNILGAIVTKSLSLDENIGNAPPRISEVTNGLINSIGLENIGLERFKREIAPEFNKLNTNIIVSFFGKSLEDFCIFAKKIEDITRINALEVNISCPNVKFKTMNLNQYPKGIYNIVKDLRRITSKSLIIKLSSNVSNIKDIAKAACDGGCDGLTLVNTVKGLTCVDKNTILCGGISGPMVKPIALRAISEVRNAVDIPIIGCGGIFNINDVLEYLRIGACAVQIGTANFKYPNIMMKLIEELKNLRT